MTSFIAACVSSRWVGGEGDPANKFALRRPSLSATAAAASAAAAKYYVPPAGRQAVSKIL